MADIFVSYARRDEPVPSAWPMRFAARAMRSGATTSFPPTEPTPSHRRAAEVGQGRRRPVVGRSGEVAMGARRGRSGASRAERWSRPSSTAPSRRCLSTRSSARTSAAGTGDRTRPAGASSAASVTALAGAAASDSEKTAAARRPVCICVLPVREHERRCRAGIFQRRHQRGHHHRPVEGLGAGGGRAQHRFHLQGPIGRRLRGRAQAGGQPRAGRQRAQGGRASADHRPADRRRDRRASSGPSATTATSSDIFAIQDEISKAIVSALKVKLLPEEKKAIEQRGTTNAEAYNLYLMARQYWVTGNHGDPRREERVMRICSRAVEIDPYYAQAWALLAIAQSNLRYASDATSTTASLPRTRRWRSIRPSPRRICRWSGGWRRSGSTRRPTAEMEPPSGSGRNSWEVNKEAGRFYLPARRRRGDAALRESRRGHGN